MRRSQLLVPMLFVFLAFLACQKSTEGEVNPTGQESSAQKVRMTMKAEIATSSNGYIIRGQMPPQVYTVMNPDPSVLDDLVASARVVEVEMRVVSGDNVAIEKIDGKKYQQEIQ